MKNSTQLTSVEIGQAGETHVSNFLRIKNFQNIWQDTSQQGATDVTATGIRVQVKTAVAPFEPADVSGHDKEKLMQIAAVTNSQAWLAFVQINQSKELSRDITWVRLL